MKNKQVYIDLLNKALTVPEQKGLGFYDIQDELIDLLNKSKSQSLYTKQLTYLYRQFNEYYSNGGFHSDDLIKKIESTIAILNTPLKELEAQEAAIQKQLALDEYHKELPLKLLKLLAEAHHLDIEYKVWNPYNKNIEVVLYEPYYNEVGLYKGTTEVEIKLNGQPWEYYEAERVIQSAKERLKEDKRKQDLIAAAKAKLTDEEKDLLGL